MPNGDDEASNAAEVVAMERSVLSKSCQPGICEPVPWNVVLLRLESMT
jgi:hypothetical protein